MAPLIVCSLRYHYCKLCTFIDWSVFVENFWNMCVSHFHREGFDHSEPIFGLCTNTFADYRFAISIFRWLGFLTLSWEFLVFVFVLIIFAEKNLNIHNWFCTEVYIDKCCMKRCVVSWTFYKESDIEDCSGKFKRVDILCSNYLTGELKYWEAIWIILLYVWFCEVKSALKNEA